MRLQVSTVYAQNLFHHSVPNHPVSLSDGDSPSLRNYSVPTPRSWLRLQLADSPTTPGRNGFVSYGLVDHFPLLSTLPRGNAVMFGFGPGEVRRGIPTSLVLRTHVRTSTGTLPVNSGIP